MTRRNLTALLGAILGVLCALLLLTLTAQAAPNDAREEFHQTYPLAVNGRLSLSNVNGDVRITAWDQNEVKIDAVKHSSDAEKVKGTRIVVDANPDSISIESKYEHDSSWFGFHNSPAAVDYTIQVPRSARLDKISLVNGSLTISNVGGGVQASCVNGGINAEGISGNVEMKSVNSSVHVSVAKVASNIALHSVNGGVMLTIPSDSKAEITASSVNGSISNDFGLNVNKGAYVGRKLSGRLGSGGTQISLKTVNGSISINHANDGKPLSKATDLQERHESREPL